MTLSVPSKHGRRWDLVALGEVMLRLDPGEGRIHTAREFRVWEGGGEYNVARGLKRCFGLETALVTAFADNPVGRLVQDLIYQGGVDQSHVRWVKYDGVGRESRNGLNFVERGFGIRAGVGCSDRGHTAVSQLRSGDIDWPAVFERDGARWLHTGGIFCALSDTTPAVAREAMEAARRHQARVSFDLNYRESLWRANGGHAAAIAVNRSLVPLVDVLIGNEEDFSAALGFAVDGVSNQFAELDLDHFKAMLEKVVREFPNLKVVATTLRHAKTATGQRLVRDLLVRRRLLRGDAAQQPGDPRPHRRRRFVRVRADLRVDDESRSAVGGRVRRGPWRAGDDDAGRHEHGDAGGRRAGDEGRHGAGVAVGGKGRRGR
jgi:2-dehydro-3-deoxygluconokinase